MRVQRPQTAEAVVCATQLNMIDLVMDRKTRLLMDQQWLERREVVEIPPKGDCGESGDNEKKNV